MLANKANYMRMEIISSKYYNDVIEHLRRTFFADEPLNKAVNLIRPGQAHPLLEHYSLSTLKDDVSVMAISNNGEIAGVALNGILNGNTEMQDSLETLKTIEDEKYKKIFRMLYEQNLKINLFKQFDVDKIFEIRILSVDPKYRGQGIAKKLMEKSEKIALERGFQVMKTDATGVFSQRAVSSLGFITRSELKYSEYLDDQGEQIFAVEPPHEKLKIMFKVIN